MRSRDDYVYLTLEPPPKDTSTFLADQAGLFSNHPPSPGVPPHLSPHRKSPPASLPVVDRSSGQPPTPPRRTVSRTPPRRSSVTSSGQYSSLSPSASFSSQDSDPLARQVREHQMRQSRPLRPVIPLKQLPMADPILEDETHALFDCPEYKELRDNTPELLQIALKSRSTSNIFNPQMIIPLNKFLAACRTHRSESPGPG
eukprot:sb/3470689/